MHNNSELILNIKQKLTTNLSGYNTQKLMEPPMRNTFSLDHSTARKAATLLPLYFDKEWKFILIQRSGNPLDKHKGQISFPGGSIEKNELPEEAAVRETHEEINIPQDNIELLGRLSDLFVPVSNFIINPFVGLVNMDKVTLKKEEAEVAEILHISLSDFMDDENVLKKTMTMPNGIKINDVPYYQINNNIIWGATAMILSEFREILKEQ